MILVVKCPLSATSQTEHLGTSPFNPILLLMLTTFITCIEANFLHNCKNKIIKRLNLFVLVSQPMTTTGLITIKKTQMHNGMHII